MITRLKLRKKLLRPKHYFILVKHFLFDNHNCYKRKNSDIKQENTTKKKKNPEINFTFLLLFHCFPITQTEIEHKPNINVINK